MIMLSLRTEQKYTPPTQQELYEQRQEERKWREEIQDRRRRDNPATGNVYAGIMSMRKGD